MTQCEATVPWPEFLVWSAWPQTQHLSQEDPESSRPRCRGRDREQGENGQQDQPVSDRGLATPNSSEPQDPALTCGLHSSQAAGGETAKGGASCELPV